MSEEELLSHGDLVGVTGFYDKKAKRFRVAITFGEYDYRVDMDGARQLRDALTHVIQETEKQAAQVN